MTDQPGKTGALFIVTELRGDKWHHLLTTKNEAEAREMLKQLGTKASSTNSSHGHQNVARGCL